MMASIAEAPRHSPFGDERGRTREIPVLASTAPSAPSSGHSYTDPMDLSPHATASRDRRELQPSGSPTSERYGASSATPSEKDGHTNGLAAPVLGAAAAAQQPKVMQTAFIHKLYRYEALATCAIIG